MRACLLALVIVDGFPLPGTAPSANGQSGWRRCERLQASFSGRNLSPLDATSKNSEMLPRRFRRRRGTPDPGTWMREKNLRSLALRWDSPQCAHSAQGTQPRKSKLARLPQSSGKPQRLVRERETHPLRPCAVPVQRIAMARLVDCAESILPMTDRIRSRSSSGTSSPEPEPPAT